MKSTTEVMSQGQPNLSCLLQHVWFALLLMMSSLVPATATVNFGYIITASGNKSVIAFPPQVLTWTTTVSSSETCFTSEIKNGTLRASAHASGATQHGETRRSFVPAKDKRITVHCSGSDDVAWGVQVLKNGQAILTRTQFSPTPSGELDVLKGVTYELWVGVTGRNGNVSGWLSFPDWVSTENSAVRTATYSAPTSVNAPEGAKFIGPIPYAAYPQPQQAGGVLGASTFVVQDNNGDVVTWLDGANVYASTMVSQTNLEPWSAASSSTATIDATNGILRVTSTTLSAPNGDTIFTVVDDKTEVQTWMEGNTLFARLGEALQFSSALQRTHVGMVLTGLTLPGRTLVVEASSNLTTWLAIGRFTNTTPAFAFTDTNTTAPIRYYRGHLE